MQLFIIEIKKKNKWSLLIEVGGRLGISDLSTIFYDKKSAQQYARDFLHCEKAESSYYDEHRISSIKPIEVQK